MFTPPRPGLEVSRRFSVRRSLLFAVLACILPALAVIAWLVRDSYLLKQETVERSATVIAQDVMARLETELAVIESSLRLLSTSTHLVDGDFRAFQQQAEAAVGASSILNFVLTDALGHQRINTLTPYGSPLPTTGTPPALDAVFTDKVTVLTPLFVGPVTGQPTIAMGVPVWHDGRVLYSMNIGMGPGHINALLASIELPPGWLIAVLDSEGVIVGRSRDADAFIGRPAVPSLMQALQQQPSGLLRSTTQEGVPVVTAFQTSARWQWSVAVGAPEDELRAALLNNTRWALLAIALTLSIGVGLAWRLGQRVLRSIDQLNAQAVGITEGKQVPAPRLQMEEALGVSQALQQASEAMGQALFEAQHDPLTGLGNRAYMETEGQRLMSLSRRLGTPLGLLMVDLDGFKAVNDTYGHAAGDQVLKTVAERILSMVRREDIVVRLGGDEFCIMFYSTETQELLRSANRIIQALTQPYTGVDCRVGASAGAVMIQQPDEDISVWMRRADKALYAAKAAGKGRVMLSADGKNTQSQ